MKVSNYNSYYIQKTIRGTLMKNILKREFNKGKHVSQIIFSYFLYSFLISLLFFLINFLKRKIDQNRK